jgi:two-component system, NtrC family, sensor histidine kinase HydH
MRTSEKPSDQPTVGIDALALRLAHDIRNPLTSIKLLVQSAAKQAGGGRLGQRQMAVIQEGIARIEQTLEELLEFARPPQPRPCAHDLRETLRRAVAEVEGRAHDQDVTISLELPPAPVTLDADRSQLQQVFVNLLLNAIHASDPGRAIQVILADDANPSSVGTITFSHIGRSLPPELIDRVFDPFPAGVGRCTGLALAISRGIVERHGGSLTVASPCAGMTVFTIELPFGRGRLAG